MILVDTGVWVDFFNGADTPHRRTLHRLLEADEDLAISGLFLAEVLQGVLATENGAILLAKDRDFKALGQVLELKFLPVS
ncbi:MAG: PIN domain-containing protein [Candidatus Riflebacteria bacterium]|nr:PIN domain-containing protein [Candidatus Riflebacteria bacterium]